jgi:hypothetical protein
VSLENPLGNTGLPSNGRPVLSAIAVVAMSLLLLLVLVVIPYHASRLSGDAQIRDSGVWSHPRYTISFPKIEVADHAAYRYRVMGLPESLLTFTLRLVDSSSTIGASPEVDTQGWHLTVSISDSRGRRIYGASAVLSEWIAARSVDDVRIWHPDLRDLSFDMHKKYLLEILWVGPVGDQSGLLFIPELSGGGIELP